MTATQLAGDGGIVPAVDRSTARSWDERVLGAHSIPHFMQSHSWAEARRPGPWRSERLELVGHPVQRFARVADGFGTVHHLPRVSGVAPGSVAALTESLLADRGDAIGVKLEVYQPVDEALVRAFREHGWVPSRASQYRHGVVVDTARPLDDILAGMKKRARAEIRIAERNGVVVRRVDFDPPSRRRMHELVAMTSERSQSLLRSRDYLDRVWSAFERDGRGHLYFASCDGTVVAGAVVLEFGPNAWYKDGGSTRTHPKAMASRLLHWRIIRDLAEAGTERYDLGNIPPADAPHPAGSGLRVFKTGFAREEVEFMPAFDLAYRPEHARWRAAEAEFLRDYRARTGDYWY